MDVDMWPGTGRVVRMTSISCSRATWKRSTDRAIPPGSGATSKRSRSPPPALPSTGRSTTRPGSTAGRRSRTSSCCGTYHLRERDGPREVDVVIETGAGDLVAVEVKATSAPSRDEARHLMWLRDLLGDRFRAGAVLHTGRHPFRLADRVLALPICTLWG
jgi:hypothetical protein